MLAKKMQWLRKSQIKYRAVASDQAGSLGEELARAKLQGMFKKLHGKAMVFQSLRVPKYQGSGKYEVDLLLVTEVGILVIEVKHWGGRLSRQRGKWLQERGNEKKILVDPIHLNADKAMSLIHWLAQRNIHLPDHAVHSIVLFTNPQVVMSPDLKQCGAVVEMAVLEALTLAKCGQPKRRFWQKKISHKFNFSSLVEALKELPTWDRLQLHGGRVVFGDLEYMSIPEIQASAVQRKYLRKADVRMQRNVLPGLFLKARLRVTDWAGRRKVYLLHPDAKLVFRPAGQNEKEEISWVHVESLQLGWKDHSYYNER
ncbi:MAG TPA: nuclease-related domain-containing protein [Oligoflexus sp.]|uniref:nuclease-related domain-containing protein n=1 Tax=Oligoflexus sp. TaxID=1971216 RepID=UPI002D5B536D|nr:nuclease-related domain-containing protein [Oligoflexus sp.]HYX34413.1 nuclease-related domain-containing protein [Oligoflexus sp.]